MAADHGEFYFLHSDIVTKASAWMDEICLRERGFKVSELHSIEAMIARLSTAEMLTDEGKAELERLQDEYRRVWRPRRVALDSVFGR